MIAESSDELLPLGLALDTVLAAPDSTLRAALAAKSRRRKHGARASPSTLAAPGGTEMARLLSNQEDLPHGGASAAADS